MSNEEKATSARGKEKRGDTIATAKTHSHTLTHTQTQTHTHTHTHIVEDAVDFAADAILQFYLSF